MRTKRYISPLCEDLGWTREDVESWLWHGSDEVQEILHCGLTVNHSNVKTAKYGAGAYFARVYA